MEPTREMEQQQRLLIDRASEMQERAKALQEQNATLGAELSEAHQEIESLRQERDELAKRLEHEQRAHAATADSCAKEISTLKAALQRQVER